MYGSALRSEFLIPETVGFRAPLADRRASVRVDRAASLRGSDWLRAVIDRNPRLRFVLRLLGLPLRNVFALVHPVGLHTNFASSFPATAMFQVSGDRRRWRVVAGHRSMSLTKAGGLCSQDKIEPSAAPSEEPWPHQQTDSLELIPARHNPNPVRLSSWRIGLNEWPCQAPTHVRSELGKDIFISHSDLEARLEASFVGSTSTDTDISLTFKQSSAPRDFGNGYFCHELIVASHVAAHNTLSATSKMSMEV